MTENININELIEAAKQYDIELTEDQLDGIAGGNTVGIFTPAFNELRGKIMEIKNSKESGMSVEDFIAANYSQGSDELISIIKLVWQCS